MNHSSRRRAAGALLTLAGLGQAQVFFGNVYEAVVKVPHRFAHQRDLVVADPSLAKLLRPGNPMLYYVPAAPLTMAASLAALGAGWRGPHARGWLVTSAAATASVGALTAYVVREINGRLFFEPEPPRASERDALLRRWYRLNAVRIAAAGVAWFSSERARAGTRG